MQPLYRSLIKLSSEFLSKLFILKDIKVLIWAAK